MRGSGIQQNPAFDFAGKSALSGIKKERVFTHSLQSVVQRYKNR